MHARHRARNCTLLRHIKYHRHHDMRNGNADGADRYRTCCFHAKFVLKPSQKIFHKAIPQMLNCLDCAEFLAFTNAQSALSVFWENLKSNREENLPVDLPYRPLLMYSNYLLVVIHTHHYDLSDFGTSKINHSEWCVGCVGNLDESFWTISVCKKSGILVEKLFRLKSIKFLFEMYSGNIKSADSEEWDRFKWIMFAEVIRNLSKVISR